LKQRDSQAAVDALPDTQPKASKHWRTNGKPSITCKRYRKQSLCQTLHNSFASV